MRFGAFSPEHRGTFQHYVCTASKSEGEVYKKFRAGYRGIPQDEDPECYSAAFKVRHARCSLWDPNVFPVMTMEQRRNDIGVLRASRRNSRLDLSVLGTCRQIYTETNILLWTTNTFSFVNPLSLKEFVKILNPMQKRKLAAVHMNFLWNDYLSGRMTKEILPGFSKKLSGLHTLRLTLGCYDYVCLMNPAYVSLDETEGKNVLSPLEMLPLKHVSVVFCHDTADKGYNFATLEEKSELAQKLQEKLLSSKGP